MKKTEIDYNDVGTFPKFAKAAIRIMLEMLRCMMKKKDPPVLSVNGRMIYLTEHLMKLLGFSVRKVRQLRADDEIEYMIDRTFVSSRSPEGRLRKKMRNERFNNLGAK